ncbi:MAG: von Willebrand factor type A domain-containing protein [Desulfuromonadales bacterium]|nr:von Willebrand factor type A domain-containing protein [Desulfuromonadales bacterium]
MYIEPEVYIGAPPSHSAPQLTSAPRALAKVETMGFIHKEPDTKNYAYREDNSFKDTLTYPLSTFSIDVDTASYSNVRRMLRENQLPQPGAVKTEEMINYFSYNYPQPEGDVPVSIYQELTECPWNSEHQLLHIGLQDRHTPFIDHFGRTFTNYCHPAHFECFHSEKKMKTTFFLIIFTALACSVHAASNTKIVCAHGDS